MEALTLGPPPGVNVAQSPKWKHGFAVRQLRIHPNGPTKVRWCARALKTGMKRNPEVTYLQSTPKRIWPAWVNIAHSNNCTTKSASNKLMGTTGRK